MSRSFGVKILLPMDQHNSDEVYAADEKLEKVSSDKEDGKYYKTLKIRSTYASRTDIRAYLIRKHGLSEEDFRNYSASYRFGYYNYHFGNGKEIVLTDAEYESLTREHVDEDTYCLVFRHFSPDVYSSVLYELFGDDEEVVDDDLINKTIDMIGKDYARQNEDREEDEEFSSNHALEDIIDYEYSMDGKLLVSLIIGREIAKRIGGIAVAYYE